MHNFSGEQCFPLFSYLCKIGYKGRVYAQPFIKYDVNTMASNLAPYLDMCEITDIDFRSFMINYDLKSKLFNDGTFDLFMTWQRSNYFYYLLVAYGNDYPSEFIPYLNSDIHFILSDVEVRECRRIYDAWRSRTSMLRKRIISMITQQCIFLTLTFTDDVLHSTNSDTRRRYIVKFLSQFNAPCIANKDFGKENGREHYHAIIQLSHIDYDLYKFGAINGKRVVIGEYTDVRIAKYISKLTNHAIKDTTRGSRLIYLHMDRLFSPVDIPNDIF